MASTLSSVRSDFLKDLRRDEPTIDEKPYPREQRIDWSARKKPPLGRRVVRAVARFVIVFGGGIGATLAWQNYGDVATDTVARAYPQYAWMIPRTTPPARAVETTASAASAAQPTDLQPFKETLLNLAAVRQSIDQLTVQIAAGQQQMSSEIARLQAAEDDILHRISTPPPRAAAPPARKPVTLTPTAQPVQQLQPQPPGVR